MEIHQPVEGVGGEHVQAAGGICFLGLAHRLPPPLERIIRSRKPPTTIANVELGSPATRGAAVP